MHLGRGMSLAPELNVIGCDDNDVSFRSVIFHFFYHNYSAVQHNLAEISCHYKLSLQLTKHNEKINILLF